MAPVKLPSDPNGAYEHQTLQVKGRAIPGAANPCDVLATARAASGM
jgi:hypothetical protein